MRRGPSLKRKPEPDPIYNSLLVSQLINQVLLDGKKDLASNIVYSALQLVEKQTSADPLNTLKDAFENVRPQIETKSRRVGGATYQVPVEVKSSRQNTLAMRWLIDSARKRNEKSMMRKLAAEIFDASENKGAALKKREDTLKMAEANKAFSHFRW